MINEQMVTLDNLIKGFEQGQNDGIAAERLIAVIQSELARDLDQLRVLGVQFLCAKYVRPEHKRKIVGCYACEGMAAAVAYCNSLYDQDLAEADWVAIILHIANKQQKDVQMTKFIIVKHADEVHHSHYYEQDPKMTGLPIEYSAASSYSGLQTGLEETYNEYGLASDACRKINELNPSGGYAVVKLIEK